MSVKFRTSSTLTHVLASVQRCEVVTLNPMTLSNSYQLLMLFIVWPESQTTNTKKHASLNAEKSFPSWRLGDNPSVLGTAVCSATQSSLRKPEMEVLLWFLSRIVDTYCRIPHAGTSISVSSTLFITKNLLRLSSKGTEKSEDKTIYIAHFRGPTISATPSHSNWCSVVKFLWSFPSCHSCPDN